MGLLGLESQNAYLSRKKEENIQQIWTALQQHWPLVRMELMSFLSSSAVHGLFFNPTLSQQDKAANSKESSWMFIQSNSFKINKFQQKLTMTWASNSINNRQRGYYRCSSSKACPARKQVERSRTDPNMLEPKALLNDLVSWTQRISNGKNVDIIIGEQIEQQMTYNSEIDNDNSQEQDMQITFPLVTLSGKIRKMVPEAKGSNVSRLEVINFPGAARSDTTQKGHDFGYVAVVGTTRGAEVRKRGNVGFLLWRSGKRHNVKVVRGTFRQNSRRELRFFVRQ
ncbi:hypothetical protein JHK87_012278 [Glycine soja]|nr:hypothetical protein JHK87_012278 [Glycine soja]